MPHFRNFHGAAFDFQSGCDAADDFEFVFKGSAEAGEIGTEELTIAHESIQRDGDSQGEYWFMELDPGVYSDSGADAIEEKGVMVSFEVVNW